MKWRVALEENEELRSRCEAGEPNTHLENRNAEGAQVRCRFLNLGLGLFRPINAALVQS